MLKNKNDVRTGIHIRNDKKLTWLKPVFFDADGGIDLATQLSSIAIFNSKSIFHSNDAVIVRWNLKINIIE